jgi:hypothetical protein
MGVVNRISPNQKAYACIHIGNNAKPVLLVSREGGDWCFLCGQLHPQEASAYRVVGIGHLFEQDPTLLTPPDLPAEWEAERQDVGSSWIRTKCNIQDG